MSKPTKEEVAKLKTALGDSAEYHKVFDDLLEEKLIALDPEWAEAMFLLYNKSTMHRWYA